MKASDSIEILKNEDPDNDEIEMKELKEALELLKSSNDEDFMKYMLLKENPELAEASKEYKELKEAFPLIKTEINTLKYKIEITTRGSSKKKKEFLEKKVYELIKKITENFLVCESSLSINHDLSHHESIFQPESPEEDAGEFQSFTGKWNHGQEDK